MTYAVTWRSVGLSAVRAWLAAALAACSFVALQEKYRGDCLFLDWQMFAFMVFFAGLFLVCFIWLVLESVRPVAILVGVPATRATLLGMLVGIVIYSCIASVTWQVNPTTHPPGDRGTRGLLAVFWPVGVLQQTGNYSSEFCGY